MVHVGIYWKLADICYNFTWYLLGAMWEVTWILKGEPSKKRFFQLGSHQVHLPCQTLGGCIPVMIVLSEICQKYFEFVCWWRWWFVVIGWSPTVAIFHFCKEELWGIDICTFVWMYIPYFEFFSIFLLSLGLDWDFLLHLTYLQRGNNWH